MEKTKPRHQTLIIALLILFLLPILFSVYFFFLNKSTPTPLKRLPTLSLEALPPFQFTAQNGKIITHDSLLGKIVVADFFFTTCPGICKSMTANMKLLQDTLMANKDVFHTPIRLISHTVNPTNDSVPVLAEYAKLHDADPKLWWMVTGNKDSLYNLSTGFYKLPAVDMSGEDSVMAEPFVHSERFVLLDREGYIRGYYDGTDSAMVAQLIKDLLILDIVNFNQDKKKKRNSLRKTEN
jgi:protein SCO1/2